MQHRGGYACNKRKHPSALNFFPRLKITDLAQVSCEKWVYSLPLAFSPKVLAIICGFAAG